MSVKFLQFSCLSEASWFICNGGTKVFHAHPNLGGYSMTTLFPNNPSHLYVFISLFLAHFAPKGAIPFFDHLQIDSVKSY